MLSFSEFINESIADDKIVKNPSLDAMRNLAKRFHEKYGENLRYAIRKDGSTVAGRSGKYTHWHLADGDPSEEHHIEGGVHYRDGEWKFSAIDQYNNYRDETNRFPFEHPIVARMRSKMKMDNTLEESRKEKKKKKKGLRHHILHHFKKAMKGGHSKKNKASVPVRKKL